MASKGNIVKFLHYTGTEQDWLKKINDGTWESAIVFGHIYDTQNRPIGKKIYAGQDSAGRDYIYDFISSNSGVSAKTFGTYDEALEYVSSDSAGEGQIVTVTGGSNKGSYIILQNVDNGDLELVVLNQFSAKWTYGSYADGWHNADALTTASVGGILEGTRLGTLIDETEGGDLSRIIETMLFAKLPPKIGNYKVQIDATQPQRKAKVSFSITDYELPATTKIYVNTIESTDDARIIDAVDGTNIVDALEPGTTYYILVESTNEKGTTTSDWKTIKTSIYQKPTVTMPSNITYQKKPNTNKAIMSFDQADVVDGDYDVSHTSKKYSLYDVDNDVIIKSGYENITGEELNYGQTYRIIFGFDAEYKDHTGDVEHFEYTSDDIFIKFPNDGGINITKVETGSYTAGAVHNITDEAANISFNAAARLTTASVKVYHQETIINTYNITNSIEASFELPTSDMVENVDDEILIELFDEYGVFDTKTIRVKYLVERPKIDKLNVIAGENQHRDAIVEFKVSGKAPITSKLYITTSNNIAGATPIDIDNEGTYTAEHLDANTTYYFTLVATNTGGQETSMTTLKTKAYVKPTATLSFDLVPTNTNNKLKLVSNSFNVTYNDYKSNGDETVYKLNGATKTLNQLTAGVYDYDTKYTIVASQNVVLADDTDDAVEVVSATANKTVNSVAPIISIVSINGEDYDETTDYIFDKNTFDVGLELNPGLHDANVEFKVNGVVVKIENNKTSGYGFVETISNLTPSEDAQTLEIVASNEYKSSTPLIFEFIFSKQIINYVGALGTNDTYTYNIDWQDGTDEDIEFSYTDFGNTPEEVVENSINESYDPLDTVDEFGDAITNQIGNFLVDAAEDTFEDLSTLDVLVKDGKEYSIYQTPASKDEDKGIIYAMVPDGLNISFYYPDITGNTPEKLAPCKKSSKAIIYDEEEYYIYYLTYGDGGNTFFASDFKIFILKEEI